MVALVRAMAAPDHPGAPVLVVGNVAGAKGLERAKDLGVETALVESRGRTREAFEKALAQRLEEAKPDIIPILG